MAKFQAIKYYLCSWISVLFLSFFVLHLECLVVVFESTTKCLLKGGIQGGGTRGNFSQCVTLF